MNVMNIPMRCLLTALLLGVGTGAGAQLELRTEAQLSASGGDHTPLWLNANKYGLSSLDRTNGYVRAGLFRPLQLDSARRWGWGAGADVAVAGGYTSTLVVQQAYGELRWLKGLLTVGSKEQPMELHNQALSSGPQTLGVNARPVPGVRLAMPVYWDVPGLRGWLGLKGHLFYGLTTDDHWQRDFSYRASTYTEHTMLHTKAGYLRIGHLVGHVAADSQLRGAYQLVGDATQGRHDHNHWLGLRLDNPFYLQDAFYGTYGCSAKL